MSATIKGTSSVAERRAYATTGAFRDATKRCAACGKIKTVVFFHKNKAHRDGLSSCCGRCSVKRSQKRANRNKLRNTQGVFTTRKTCASCGGEKESSFFDRDAIRKDGLSPYCKQCRSAKIKNRINKIKKKYTNKKPLRRGVKKCIACKNVKQKKEFCIDRTRVDGFSPRCKKCAFDLRKKIHLADPEKKRENDKAYIKKRRTEDINFKILGQLRSRVKAAIKYQQTTKSNNTVKLLGCSIDFARKHIESLFLEGMTWDNHGIHGWHIDHIRPCASFDLTDPKQQRKCFHYSNLQPLWAVDNIRKGSKINRQKRKNV